jgi:hypothetical protein
MLNLRSFIVTLTTIMAALSGLAVVLGVLGALRSATSISDLLNLLVWWYVGAPLYSAVLEILIKMLRSVFVRWIGIPLYLFAFAWQLSMLAL